MPKTAPLSNVPQPLRLVVKNRSIDLLKLDPDNPRRHSRQALRALARNIEANGIMVPLLIDAENNVICGGARLLVAKELGYQEVPIILIDHLSKAQVRAYRIADNRLVENGTWDEARLVAEFSILTSIEVDFNLELTGFDFAEVDVMRQRVAKTGGEDADRAEDIPDLAAEPPVTVAGDIWVLGRHRVLCGNAIDPEAYAALMKGERAALVATDPPYNVRISGHVSGTGKHGEFAMASGEMTPPEFTGFLKNCLELGAKHSIPGAVFYVFMDHRHTLEILTAAQAAKLQHLNTCVWVKHNAGMGSLYRSQHEFVFVFKNGKARHRNNVQLGRFDRTRTNVWDYRGASGFGGRIDEGNLLELHPTSKPVALMQDALLDCSVTNDIVLDLFLGSGSTLIAAERSGRRCFGLEIEPHFVDVIIERWQRYGGGQAVHAATGKTFAEVKALRTRGNENLPTAPTKE